MPFVKGQPFKPQFVDEKNGRLMSGGTIEFYQAGTSTPTEFFSDAAGTSGGVSLTLNGAGKPETDLFYDSDEVYKMIVKNSVGEVVETINDYSPSSVSSGTSSVSLIFTNVKDMMARETISGTVTLEAGQTVAAGLTTFVITETATNLRVDDGLFALAIGDLWADDFLDPESTDDGPGLRLMRDHAEALGRKVLLRSSGRDYNLETTETVPTYGGEVGLYITSLKRIRIDFSGSIIAFDTSIPALGAATKDAVFAIAPPAAGDDYAFGNIKNIDFNGGNWATKEERPINVIKANYRILAYSLFEDIRCLYAQEDVWKSDGFVMLMRKVRARFAGTSHAGIRLETTSAAKTGYLLDGCTVDYAGNYGFEVTGASGHTYCHMNNCHADFVGRDDDGSIIEANVTTAHAYRIRDVRVFNLTACGAEYCTMVLDAHNTRSLSIDGLFSLGAGHTDNVTEVDHLINVNGYFEQVNINNFENRSPKTGGSDCWLAITNIAAYNTNKVLLDTSIPLNKIRYDGGTQSSSGLPLVMTPEQLYKGNYRKGPGEAVKSGLPQVGASATAPYSSTDVLEQTWFIETGASSWSQDLIDVTQRTGGNVTFFFEIMVCRSTSTAPSSYLGAITVRESDHGIVAPAPTVIGGSGSYPTIGFTDDRVSITLPNAYAGHYIKVTAVQRAGSNYARFEWL